MGRRPRDLTPDASVPDRFGAELRRWRLARGLTQRGLAGLIWHSQELVAKVEKAERWPSWYLATRCDVALRKGGLLARLWPAVERQRLAGDRRGPLSAGQAAADHAADRS
ncbi:MAG TPA: helix-turn-helix transcriptional regulator [Streptosporangiaceae bacterium]|nr:helix-turn-helix transcriptional regulator [Streptosporangiaceae bacterium]